MFCVVSALLTLFVSSRCSSGDDENNKTGMLIVVQELEISIWYAFLSGCSKYNLLIHVLMFSVCTSGEGGGGVRRGKEGTRGEGNHLPNSPPRSNFVSTGFGF